MQHEALSVLISEQRLSTYYKMFNGNKHKAFEYYQLNIQIAQSLYPLLLYTEISLRNLIHHSCSIHFKMITGLSFVRNKETGYYELSPPSERKIIFPLKYYPMPS